MRPKCWTRSPIFHALAGHTICQIIAYVGCQYKGDDYDILTNKLHSPGAANPAAAAGFQFSQSSSWSNHILAGNVQLPNHATGLYVTDNVAAGPNPEAALTSTISSTVAGVVARPYLLGIRPSNTSRSDNSPPSFLTNLKAQNGTPSLSFGYTAGAAYSKHDHSTIFIGSLLIAW